ncbi:MAG TPA: 3-deoxy-8-phosphooctulonate synthase [Candidatus Kapabacteria bacterium]|nr:3-deoxy-8-phosphooctulonate synthase [Candidatus Kapabacteria bacterium]HPO63851.1 3-deoxy-8-phosphooctulonate synthase [Candidatus Kapabacteria bacterium]
MEKKPPFLVIAGPCVIESKEMLFEVAAELKRICSHFNIEYIFKSSYKKANRTSANSFTGIGDETALSYLAEVKEKFSIRVLTDIHSVEEAKLASQYVDILQIPAFLCRQTELLQAAAKTGKTVSIKKGQFLAPEDIGKAAEKVKNEGNNNIWLTERGTFFGYHNLVVDFRSFIIMKEFGYPVIYDATHSVQLPSQGEVSSGQPQFIIPLAKAAAAVGIDGLFFETHPEPQRAKSDAASQLPLNKAEEIIKQVLRIIDN